MVKKYTILTLCFCLMTLFTSVVGAQTVGRGDRGTLVSYVQELLITQGYLIDTADGIFGNNTEYAVKVFQKDKKLTVDGRVGSETLGALEENNKKFSNGQASRNIRSNTEVARYKSRGTPTSYRKVLTMSATAYSSEDPGNGKYTAGGHILKKGYVSVDPDVIPLGTELYIEGYGYAIADDTGGAIQGNRIDLGMNSHSEAIEFGSQTVRVYIL